MENFAPGLREAVVSLANSLRVAVYFLCVAGLMLQIQRARSEVENMAAPVVRAILIVGLVATLPQWFALTERMFLGVADGINSGYTEHPMRSSAQVRGAVADSGDEWNFRRVGETLYKAFLYAAAKLVVLGASVLQFPFLLLQYVLKLLCYLFLPVALALFMVPSLVPLGTRYLQQTLAVLAWPVGFSVTELVSFHLFTAYGSNLAAAYDLRDGEINAASFASLIGGLLAAIWLIVGTIGTPFLMQALFCSGTPLTGGGQSALQQLASVRQLAGLVLSLKTGGASLAASGSGPSQPMKGATPTQPLPGPPAPSPAPPTTATTTDSTGDQRAAAALNHAQLPAPKTTI